MTAELTVSQVFRGHLLAIAMLAALDAIVQVGDAAGYHSLLGFSPLFRLSGEGNAPTLISALAIGATALVALRLRQMAALSAEERTGWRVLAWLLAFMALDEMLQLHELMHQLGQRLLPAGPRVPYGQLPYALAALAFAATLLRFWARQSRGVRAGLAAAAALYGVTAFGLEIVEFALVDAGARPYDPVMGVRFAAEELGEMVAIALLLRTFLARFGALGGGALLALTGERPIFAVTIRPA
jgi:hypothetical protein